MMSGTPLSLCLIHVNYGNRDRTSGRDHIRMYVEQNEVAVGKTDGSRRSLRILSATQVKIFVLARAAGRMRKIPSMLEVVMKCILMLWKVIER
jgi:hypothetical protein